MMNNTDLLWPYIYGLFLIVSLCCGSVIPIIYQFSPKCRHHPAQIFLILCLLEMIVCYQLFLDSIDFKETIDFFDRYFYLYRIESLYFFGKVDFGYNNTICEINQYIILIAFLAQLNYYIVLTVDFIISLQRPFWNTQSKVIVYHCFVILSTALLAGLEWKSLNNMCNNNQGAFGLIMEFPSYIILQILILVISLMASIYFACRNMSRIKKINKKVLQNRRKLFSNHIILLITVLIMWSVKLIPWKEEVKLVDSFWHHLCFAILLLHPSILLAIRLMEPYFRDRVKLLLETVICKRKWQENYDLNYDQVFEDSQLPLIQLVQIQTQQETVRNILSAICNIIESDLRSDNLSLSKQVKQKKVKIIQGSNLRNQVNCNNDSMNQTLIWTHDQSFLMSQVTEYAPSIFQNIRESNNINQDILLKSLRLDRNEIQIRDTQETMGRSGSLIFYSYDDSVILKTIVDSELEFLIKILPDYYNHIKESLLSTIYGLFTVKIEGYQQIHLMLMENIFQHMSKNKIIYDLKGSLVDRETQCGPDQIEQISHSLMTFKPSEAVLKDLNFIQSTDLFIKLNSNDRLSLFKILENDFKFLEKYEIMDFSLLLGVSQEKIKKSNRIFSNKQKAYCFGLIDFTQQFTFKKKLELFYKIYLGRKGNHISCVKPKSYGERLLKFINSIIIISDSS